MGDAMTSKPAVRKHAKNILRGALAVLMAMAVTTGPSAAGERGHRRGFERERHPAWRGDIHRFHERDYAHWRGGRWYHGRHVGHLGWWWIVGGIWYFYPAPVYPYPNPYLPPTAVAPPAVPPAPAGAQQYWYYCSKPPGYYPYVPRCGTAWQAVPTYPSPG